VFRRSGLIALALAFVFVFPAGRRKSAQSNRVSRRFTPRSRSA
jgi:hypothetical protein